MSTTRRPNAIQHTSAGDTSVETVLVRTLVWNGSTDAADDLTVRRYTGTSTSGDILLTLKAGTNVGHLQLDYPFGNTMVKGIETDALDAGTVEYILG